ncbi:hypothetical protein T552_00960 [Pneumocystis carinii B80]|uniref:Signal peptidase subunit 3 n=1 Tax=Pneumocystis carinii (strain B80) TaxID=1408658 RepID=A0A0W4ZN17_PNEC8|nr:hypothetical protein T552_00960 [Pneumocystis carinii B80]KTW29753.1 hypothetical protein T552_00960 [Pneumocystis carinii B80]
MYSTIQRLNTLSSLWVNALFFLCLWITVSTYFDNKYATSNVKLISAQRKTARISYSFRNIRQEYAFIRFELDTDVRPLFEWNTKQVFIYVVGSYVSSKNYPYNEVIIWSRTIRRKKDGMIRVRNQENVYSFNDIEGSFMNKNLTLCMYYNIMPQVGILKWGNGSPSGRMRFS